jgi:hypothetical protein
VLGYNLARAITQPWAAQAILKTNKPWTYSLHYSRTQKLSEGKDGCSKHTKSSSRIVNTMREEA